MPLILVSLINLMDEIKRRVVNHSEQLFLEDATRLLPAMAESYDCYELTAEEQHELTFF